MTSRAPSSPARRTTCRWWRCRCATSRTTRRSRLGHADPTPHAISAYAAYDATVSFALRLRLKHKNRASGDAAARCGGADRLHAGAHHQCRPFPECGTFHRRRQPLAGREDGGRFVRRSRWPARSDASPASRRTRPPRPSLWISTRRAREILLLLEAAARRSGWSGEGLFLGGQPPARGRVVQARAFEAVLGAVLDVPAAVAL